MFLQTQLRQLNPCASSVRQTVTRDVILLRLIAQD